MAAIKVPAFLARTMIMRIRLRPADVRQNGEKIVPEKYFYVGNLAGSNYFITVVKITVF